MDPGGRQTQEDVPGLHLVPGDHLAPFHHAYAEAGDVVFVLGIEPGHFSGFPADQGTAAFLAGIGHPFDDVGDFLGFHLGGGDVIQEEQRFRPLDQDIIDAHGHGVLADGVVTVHHKGDLQLGAHTVGTGNQHRILVFVPQGKQAPEAPQVPDDFRTVGGPDAVLHQFHGFVAGVDIHPCICVCNDLFLAHAVSSLATQFKL